jgi:head-tail adaptor
VGRQLVIFAADPRAPKVYRLRPGVATDGYGDPVASWDNPDSKLLPRAELQAVSSDETESARATKLTNERVLFVPYAADLTDSDRVKVGAEVWRVDGEVLVRRGLASPVYTTANLVRHEGA